MPAKNTGVILQRLRSLMKNSHHVSESVHAYIIPTDDAHQSEYIAEHDMRRMFVSGFTGSSGTAIVTESKAALWTDGRYYLQAEAQLDANWTLMKDGLKETPSQAEWLCKVLPVEGRVGVDPYLLPQAQWDPLSRKLTGDGHKLVAVNDNLVDLVWDDQPESPNNSVIVQPIEYTGQSWEDKVKAVRAKLQGKNAHCVVVSALDEVAWLLNLRGSDIQFNPCFFAYVIVTMDAIFLFIDEKKLSDDAVKHLGLQQNGNHSNSESSEYSITLLPYNEVITRLRDIADATDKKTWVSSKSSRALFDAIPEKKRLSEYSPVNELKAVKNSVEITGMKNAHIRDAVALCEYFWWLEKEVPKGGVTEMSGSDRLEALRRARADFVSLSFDTISGSGPNGAIIHYRSSKETNRPITTDQLYLCDSGAQYRDGTTDVTRTIHLGTPSDYERECFTHVLKGHIALAACIWPNGVKGLMLDSFARASLWQSGLDYLHGTGHGVGAFLNVHEEPGYYEDGKFGVRIESLVLVTKAQTKYNFRNKGFLTFEPITLVPIQKKMISPELLTEKEMSWLNEYHEKCREVVGEELKNQNKTEVLDWLMKETQPIG